MATIARALPAERLDDLVAALHRHGYRVIAPVLREGAVSYGEIASAAELPRGWTDRQDAGTYRLERDPRDLYFGFTLGAQSWKRYLFPPRLTLWTAERRDDGFEVHEQHEEPPPQAFLGVRPCDLAAIAVQDRVFLGGPHRDAEYRRRRERALLVAVTCSQAVSTCFCTSMGYGPRAERGFDLALTELRDDDAGHRFLVEAGSERGAEVLADVPTSAAPAADRRGAERVAAETAAQITRHMPADIAGVLRRSYVHPRWDEVAQRCLACTNCTLVCPTCFCMAVEDTTDLTGTASRDRRWDSCFTSQHSYIHGGSVHASTASRYRQWMTHKLSTWFDQFGSSGCVGCGRCITWCPAAIDITEEAAAIAAAPGRINVLTIAEAVAQCALFDGLPSRYRQLIAGCARFARFGADVAIFLEGQAADRFYVLREGRVTLEVFSPERGRIVVQTLGPGDALGWSWLFPPYRWHLDAMAREPIAAIAFDGACLRGKCHTDHELGHLLMERFGELMLERLKATRLQLLDVYAHGSR